MSNEELEKLADLIAERIAELIAGKPPGKFMTRGEYAQTYKLGLRTVDRMIKDGKLEVEKKGRKVLILVK